MSQILHNLNPPQRQAVETTEGPVLVLAGPGSGKTRVLTRRIAYLIEERGIAPWNILAVTFTNKAAREMEERVVALIGANFPPPPPGQRQRLGGLTIGTFHNICARVLRIDVEAAGFQRNWVIYDSADQLTLVRTILKEMNLDEKRFSPQAIRARIGRWKNELIQPVKVQAASYFDEICGRIYGRYQQIMLLNNAMDFDDLLMRTTLLLRDNLDVRQKYQRKWQYILVDEFQDTNTAQYQLVTLLAGEPAGRRNLFVVGDEDQCVIEGTPICTERGNIAVQKLRQDDVLLVGAGHGSIAHASMDAQLRRAYTGPVVDVRTRGGYTLTATPEHCVFGRFSSAGSYHYVYLMYAERLGYRIGRTGATRSNGKKTYPGFQERLRQERGDAIWLLQAAEDAADAAYWEARLSAQYGLPTVCFYAGGRKLAMDDEKIRRLYADLDTRSAAARLAQERGLSLDYPHHVPQATIRGGSVRKTISFTMFGSKKQRLGRTRWEQIQDPWHLHELSICSSDEQFRQEVATVLPTNAHKKHYWAARRQNGNYDELAQTLAQLRDAVSGARVWRRALFTEHRYDFMPIGHLLPGALVPVMDGHGCIVEDEVVEVTRRTYDGFVYDLSVPTYRNYVAGGIVVHNSVYRFRGADYRNVLRFRRDYPDARTILLQQNYRSTQSILDVANAVIAENSNRTPKELFTDNGEGLKVMVYEAYNEIEEAAWVCDEIARLQAEAGFRLGDCAVMYRTNAQSRALEEAFVTRQVRHRLVGATRFYERKEVKDALAYLRVVHNPSDSVALDRIVNTPPRGIGAKTWLATKDWAAEAGASEYLCLRVLHHGHDGVAEAAGHSALLHGPGLGRRAVNALANFSAMLESWVQMAANQQYESVANLLDHILEDAGYIDRLRDGSDEGEDRFANLQELRGVAAQYTPGMPGLEEGMDALSLFLQEVSLVSDADQIDEGNDAVTLMTLHTAKGLEYPVVFIVGMEERILPHARSIESEDEEEIAEERRLAYVGITRAKRRLYLLHTFRRSLWGSSEVQEPSRFLADIPPHLLRGMVDRQARRAASYNRATRWDDDNRSTWGGPTGREGKSARQSYWSPEGRSAENRPGNSSAGKTVRRPGRTRKTAAKTETQYHRRQSVQHPKYGVGTVIDAVIVGRDEEVTVAFPGVGIKKFLASIANLKKL